MKAFEDAATAGAGWGAATICQPSEACSSQFPPQAKSVTIDYTLKSIAASDVAASISKMPGDANCRGCHETPPTPGSPAGRSRATRTCTPPPR